CHSRAEKNDEFEVQKAARRTSTQECNSPSSETHFFSQPDFTLSYTQTAESLLGWLMYRMNCPSVPLEVLPWLSDIFKLANSPKARVSKPCMYELWKGFETTM
ncbi:hypothetical protein BGZ92_005587, partial [Podila epicladia]